MIFRFNIIEKVLLRLNIIPHSMMDSMISVVGGRTLQTGVKLGIFDVLNTSELKPLSYIAKKCNIDETGAQVLIECLCAMGYLESKNSNYKLSKRGWRFLAKNSPHSMRDLVLFDANFTFPRLLHLEENIRRGKPPEYADIEKITKEEREVFYGAMIEIAKHNASEIVRLAPLKKRATNLVDLGGMHGLYAIEYCRKYPKLSANIIDGASLRSYAEQTIAEHSMHERVKFTPGDFLVDKIDKNYDAALIINVVHVLPTDRNQLLAKITYQLLNPGGQIVIMDQIKDTAGNSELTKFFVASLGVMLCNNTGGRTYSFGEIKKWLEGVGFHSCKLKKMRTPGFGVIVAEK